MKTMSHYHQITLAEAHQHLTQLCEQVTTEHDIVIITPNQGAEVALLAKTELDSLLETAHLLGTPNNAVRLLTALQRAKARTLAPQSLQSLRMELELPPMDGHETD
jgi:antitoxin YefM